VKNNVIELTPEYSPTVVTVGKRYYHTVYGYTVTVLDVNPCGSRGENTGTDRVHFRKHNDDYVSRWSLPVSDFKLQFKLKEKLPQGGIIAKFFSYFGIK